MITMAIALANGFGTDLSLLPSRDGSMEKSEKEREMVNYQYIVVIGNICDGFQFVGPFPTFDDADEASRQYDKPTWIATLEEH